MKTRATLSALLLAAITLLAQAAKPAPAAEYRISGVVYDATSGQTLPGARVSLGPTTGKSVPDRTALTGPDGAFSFEHLAAGKYQMFGEAVGFPQQGFEQHEAPYLTGIVVGPDASAERLVFRLQRSCGIAGTVTDEFNEPVRDAEVMVFRKGLQNGRFNTHFARYTKTDDQGFYKAAPLLPGTYFVAVAARPWYAKAAFEGTSYPQVDDGMKRFDTAFPLTFYSGATDATDATEIVLRNGERTTADVALHSVPALRIRVQHPAHKDGRSQGPDVFLRLTHTIFGESDFPDVPAMSEQRDIEAGYSVTGGIAPGHYVAHLIKPGTSDERTREIDVTGDLTIDAETFANGGSVVKGLMEMSGGDKLPGDLFFQLQSHNGETRFSRIGEKGDFAFEPVEPGTYELSVGSSRDIFLLDMAATNAKINGRMLTVTGAGAVDVAVVLGKGMGQIRGVAQREGHGVGGTMVLLVPANPGANYVLFRRDQSDSDGTFNLPQVVPGKYSVLALQGGWDLEWSKPAVLKSYLAKAETIDVAAGGKYEVKVQVQGKPGPEERGR
jgi:Carboxypeptidase regulatory-like domain